MVKDLSCHIEIIRKDTGKKVSFNYVGEIVVNTDTKKFTDTATVIVPRLVYKDKDITEYIRRGDSIAIQAGYDGNNLSIFTGTITKVGTGFPVKIECENEAYELKQKMIPGKYYSSLTLEQFMQEWMSDYDYQVADVNLGEVKIAKEKSLSRVFEYFEKNYPLSFFWRGGVFYGVMTSSMMLRDNEVNTVKYKVDFNLAKQNLHYTLAEDIKLKVVAKTILKDNTKLEHTEDPTGDGETRTFYVPGAKSIAELKAYAKAVLETYKVDKMDGDITAFGEPYIRKGDIVHLYDDNYPERNDKRFFASKVQYRFGRMGYRQVITLGHQIS